MRAHLPFILAVRSRFPARRPRAALRRHPDLGQPLGWPPWLLAPRRLQAFQRPDTELNVFVFLTELFQDGLGVHYSPFAAALPGFSFLSSASCISQRIASTGVANRF